MKILYVTNSFSGIDEMLFDAETSIKGLPPQYKVLEALVNRGDSIDMIVMHTRKRSELKIASPVLASISNIYLLYRNPNNNLAKVFTTFALHNLVKNLISANHYDFAYLHGANAASVTRIITSYGIPCGQRAYGINYGNITPSDNLSCSERMYMSIRYHPTITMLKAKKDFLLVTKCGSNPAREIEIVCKGNPPYRWYEWSNGFERFDKTKPLSDVVQTVTTQFLFMPSRIDPIKRQDLTLQIICNLKKLGNDDIHLIFAGRVDDEKYYQQLLNIVNSNDIADRVHFFGNLSQNDVLWLDSHSLAVVFFSQFVRGNVLLEALGNGSIVLVPEENNDVADLVMKNISGLTANDTLDAARQIIRLAHDVSLQKRLREGAKHVAETNLPSWDERVKWELDLIDDVAGNRKS